MFYKFLIFYFQIFSSQTADANSSLRAFAAGSVRFVKVTYVLLFIFIFLQTLIFN